MSKKIFFRRQYKCYRVFPSSRTICRMDENDEERRVLFARGPAASCICVVVAVSSAKR